MEGAVVSSPSLSFGVAGRRVPVQLPGLRDPRLHLTAVIWTLQILGQTSLGFQVSIAQILITLGTAGLLEMAILGWRRRALIWPASALVTGNGISFILRVPGTQHGDWWSLRGAWIFAAAAAFGVLSKYLIRVNGRHLFNPSNFALVVFFLVLGTSRTEPQYFWWGPLSVWLGLALAVIAVGALAILSRLGLLRVALGFWCAFAAGIGVLAISGHAMTARWHVGPVTGWSFWWVLVTSPEIFVFLSFMITDPRTSPRTMGARWRYAVAIGLLASLLIAPQTTEFATKVGVLGALTIVCATWRVLGWLRTTATDRGWTAGLARLGARSPNSRAASAFAAFAVFAALLVLAGIPARPTAIAEPISTNVLAADLPAVSVAPTSSVSIDHATALSVARDVVVDLRLQAQALRGGNARLAAAGAQGAWLRTIQQQVRAGAAGDTIAVPTYHLRQVRISLVPGVNQAAPTIYAALAGSVDRAPFAGRPPHPAGRATSAHVEQTLTLQLRNGRYVIVDAKGGSSGLLAPPSSPFVVALAPLAHTATPQGDAVSVRVLARLRKPGANSVPAKIALSVAGPGGAPVPFFQTGLIVSPTDGASQVVSFTPTQFFAKPGTYLVSASVNGVSAGAPLKVAVSGPRIPIPRFDDVTKGTGLATTLPAPRCGEFLNTPAWGAIDSSGRLALFVPRLGAPAQLFVEDADGRFADAAAARGVNVTHAMAAAFGDYLNNGREDLFVARYGAPSLLFRNDGNGHFTDVTASAGIAGVGHASSATWVDYDDDGRLDLYVTNYMTCRGQWTSGTDSLAKVRYYGAHLFRNDGGGRFTDVSAKLPEAPRGAGLAAAWFDATGNGHEDLYLGNDFVGQQPDHNRLWLNGGHPAGASFRDVSLASGTALYMNTMGIAIGDFERNGRLDFALSNIGGNQLLLNNGNGTFRSAGGAMGVARAAQFGSYPAVTWGVGAYDFTDDGWEDLYFTAGNVNPRLTKFEGVQPSELFVNDHGRRFLDVSAPTGIASAGDAKGVAFADYNHDGLMDMYVVAQNGPAHLYRNATGLRGNHWLEVHTVGTVSNRDGCGARLLLTAGTTTMLREMLCAQDQRVVEFGLGSAARISKLQIIWPSGIRQVLRNVSVDRTVTVTEPRACAKATSPSARCAASGRGSG